MSDIVTGRIFSNGEVGITATKMNEIISRSVIQPDLIGTKPAAASAGSTDYLLLLKSDGTLAKIAGDAFNTSVANAILPQVDAKIWAARLRSFNAAGNPTFEVDQRNIFSAVSLGAGNLSLWAQDRWQNTKVAATMALTSQASMGQPNIVVPGTNFRISQAYQIITLTTAQAALAAGEACYFAQTVEGPLFRELANDVHSISILATTNVTGGLKFAIALRDPGTTRSLAKLCTITSPGVWQLITLPNLPIWASGGNFSSLPGTAGYLLSICYACGTTFTAPANDVWQNGNFVGAVGMDNLGAKPTTSYLAIAFIQHEPGAQCTTPIDCPFGRNLDGDMGCLRYYQKSCPYGIVISAAGTSGPRTYNAQAGSHIYGNYPFVKPMAKAPTVTPYAYSTNTAGAVRDTTAVVDRAANGAGLANPSEYGFAGFSLGTVNAGAAVYYFHYAADTGW